MTATAITSPAETDNLGRRVPGVIARRLYQVLRWGGDYNTDRRRTLELDEAHVVSSEMQDSESLHALVVDLDVPVELVPSTTPGHSHLYIDVPMTWTDALAILEALAEAGVVQAGYVGASKMRGFSCVRLPWIKKGDPLPKTEESPAF